MNPVDALARDYNMYYNGTWMKHKPTGRIVNVQVGEGYQFSYQLPAGVKWHETKPEELECWWPRSGSYNIGEGAVFIGRRARRNMKKSAYDHYYVSWGYYRESPLKIMAQNSKYLKFDDAVKCLNSGVSRSVAISKDIILSKPAGQPDDKFTVVYRGTEAGSLENNQFIPIYEGTPAAKRAELKLVQEGIQCI